MGRNGMLGEAPAHKPGGAGDDPGVNPTRCRACTGVFPGSRLPDKEQVTLGRPRDSGWASNPQQKAGDIPTFQAAVYEGLALARRARAPSQASRSCASPK